MLQTNPGSKSNASNRPWQGLMRHAYHLDGRQDALDALLSAESPAEEED